MKNLRHLTGFLVLMLFLENCNSRDGYQIIGHIEDIEDGTLITLYDINQQISIDTAFSLNGSFTFNGKVEYPAAYWICCKDQTATIQIENVGMTFESPIQEMQQKCKITGGQEQQLQNELNNLLHKYDSISRVCFDSLWNKKYSDEIQKQKLVEKYQNANSNYSNIYLSFGKTHLNSYFGLNIIYLNKSSIAKDSLQMFYNSLESKLKDSPDGIGLKYFLTEVQVKEGEQFVDFNAKTISDKDFMLSSLKGKYIYLTFWSAGCGPCRMENRYLSKNYKDLPDNLVVVSFNLDKNKKYWEVASREDSIIWHNISSIDDEYGKVKNIYNVSAMPTSFLINPEGLLIKKFIGYDTDETLIEQLKKMI